MTFEEIENQKLKEEIKMLRAALKTQCVQSRFQMARAIKAESKLSFKKINKI